MVVNYLRITFLILICCFCHTVNSVAVMSVDIGTEWMKVAIVSPGVPMEIALNKESQRKTPIAVAFREGERLFGDPAVTIGVRFPDKAYCYLLDVLGKKLENPVVQLFLKRFPYYKVEASDDRGTVIFKHPEGQSFTPEELMAMILKQAQEIAQNAAGQPIKDAVITVPPYFSQAERYALLLAAEMSGINVLQLINSNTATALNYGVFRRRDFNETPTNILFYDMGAGSTVASVVSYQLVKSKDTNEVSPQLTVKGVGFDRTLGGLEMQLRLRDHFAKAFNKEKKTKSDVFENSRAMAKLLKEAGRIKKVLSANTEHMAQVESLLEDIDFKCPITREEFEQLCVDLFERVIRPIDVALSSAGLSMDHIDQVILAGSGARVPKVQQILLDYIKRSELGKSINTDESAALGAAYQAAYLSKGFKVKTFLIRDINVYPIQVNFNREYEASDKTPSVKSVRRTLFGRNNLIPQKKAMTFNRLDRDFDFYVNYGDLNFLNEFELQALDSLNLSKVSVRGVSKAMEKHAEPGTEYKGVKASFRVDESGYFHFESVEAVFEKSVSAEEDEKAADVESTLSKLGSTIGRLFSSYDGTAKEDANQEAVQKMEKDFKGNESQESVNASDKTAAGNETKQSKSDKNQTDSSKKETKVVVVKEPLTSEKTVSELAQLSDTHAKEFIRRLEELDAHDKEKLAKEKAKNSLESFIIETKDKLYTDDYEKALPESEKTKVSKLLSEAGDWLEYESDGADTKVFHNKLSDLKKLTKDWFERVKENQDRPEAIKALKDMLNISEIFLLGARNMTEDEQIFTEIEMTTLEKLILDTHKWLKENLKEQASLPLYVQPKLTIKLISEKIASLDREVKYLLNKARFAKPLKKKATTEDSAANKSSTNETKSDRPTNETKVEEPVGNFLRRNSCNFSTNGGASSLSTSRTETVDQFRSREILPPSPFVEHSYDKNETQADAPESPEVAEPEVETTSQPVTESPKPDKVKDEAHTEL